MSGRQAVAGLRTYENFLWVEHRRLMAELRFILRLQLSVVMLLFFFVNLPIYTDFFFSRSRVMTIRFADDSTFCHDMLQHFS